MVERKEMFVLPEAVKTCKVWKEVGTLCLSFGKIQSITTDMTEVNAFYVTNTVVPRITYGKMPGRNALSRGPNGSL